MDKDDDAIFNVRALSNRAYYASRAMQGILAAQSGEYGYCDSREWVTDKLGGPCYDEHGEMIFKVIETVAQKIAKEAVGYADALIEALNKESE